VERRSRRQIRTKGCYHDAFRSTKKHSICCIDPKWVVMMLLVPVLRSQRVQALPFLTALCRPTEKRGQRQHKTSVDLVQQMIQQIRRWRPSDWCWWLMAALPRSRSRWRASKTR
jgi:hypothetical protein